MDAEYPKVDPKGPNLVFMVVADRIAAEIEAGKLRSGDRLPGEVDLAARHQVARMTAGRAIRELRERGLVHTVRGKGTFVV